MLKRLVILGLCVGLGCGLLGFVPQTGWAAPACAYQSTFYRVVVPLTQFVPGSAAEQAFLDAAKFDGWQLAAVVVLDTATLYYFNCVPAANPATFGDQG